MHAETCYPYIDCCNAEFGSSNRSDSTATCHVTAHNKGLIRNIHFIADSFKQGNRLTITGITLVRIDFYYRPFVEQRTMLVIVFIHIIWVYAMGIVDGQHDGLVDHPLHRIGLPN